MQNQDFDVVIIDEATQALEAVIESHSPIEEIQAS